MKLLSLSLLVVFASSSLALAQKSAPQKKVPDSTFRFTIPPEPIAPTGFDYGRMTEQGNLNEYRIGQVEADVKQIKETTDFVRGAWWAICGALAILLAVGAITYRFLGKYIGMALVDHYKKQTPP